MSYYSVYFVSDGEGLMHHGILGMKWGVRRYQNEDGTLTEAGKRRMQRVNKGLVNYEKKSSAYQKRADAYFNRANKKQMSRFSSRESIEKALDSAEKNQRKANYYYNKGAKYFEKNSKFFNNKLNTELDEDSIRRGQQFVDRIREMNNLTYASITSSHAFSERNSERNVRRASTTPFTNDRDIFKHS